jgi:hypothetical protein
MALPKSFIADDQKNTLPKSFVPDNQEKPSLAGFAGNVLSSTGNAIGSTATGILNAFNPDPSKNTLVNAGKLAVGAGENLGAMLDPNHNANHLNTPEMQMAGKFGQNLADRYGNPDKILHTAYTDPAGVLLDASTAIDGVGGLVGKAGDVSKLGEIAKFGKATQDVSHAVNPLEQLTKLLGSAVDNPLTRKAQAPFKGAYDAEAVAKAKALGVDLPVSAQTNSKFVKAGEAITERTSVFGGGIQKKVAQAHEQLDQLATDLTNKVVASPDFKGAGDIIKKGFDGYVDDFNKHKTDLYEAVPPAIQKQSADMSHTTQAIDEILSQKGQSLTGGNNTELYKGLQKTLSDKAKGKGVTIAQLKQTRTDIGSKLKNFADPVATGDKASLSKLYASLSEDLDGSIGKVDPQAGQALKDANNFYREGITKINSKLGKKIASADPEKLVDELVKPNSETSIQRVKEIIGPESSAKLQEAFLNKVFKNSVNKTGILDAQKLEAEIKKYGDPTLTNLFSPEQMAKLTDVRSQLSKIQDVRGKMRNPTANGSQTAFNVGVGSLGAMALNPGMWPILVKVIAGQYASSKVFTSPKLSKYLLQGLDVTSGASAKLKQAAPVIGKTGQAGALMRYGQGQ